MVNLDDAVRLLRVKRSELLDQLQAVDSALAALGGPGVAVTTTPGGRAAEAEEKASSGVVPTKLKSPRMLSDEHKHALNEGRRRARHSKAVAAGFAREMLESPQLTPAAADGGRPRLVKRPGK